MDTVIIIKDSVVNLEEVVETSANTIKGSDVISLRDACTCTGNCC